MTLPLEQSMEGGRARAKPIEMVARLILAFDHDCCDSEEDAAKVMAFDIISKLVRHGFITIEGLLAMKAEQEAGK